MLAPPMRRYFEEKQAVAVERDALVQTVAHQRETLAEYDAAIVRVLGERDAAHQKIKQLQLTAAALLVQRDVAQEAQRSSDERS